MSLEILGKLFSSNALVKIMRLFLSNQEQGFELADIVSHSKVRAPAARVELTLLKSIGFVKQKQFSKEIESKSRAKGKNKQPPKMIKKKVTGWFLNPSFKYLQQIQALLIDSTSLPKEEIAQKFKSAGKIKLLLVSGIFIRDNNSRVDILIVGDKLKNRAIDETVKNLEAEIGKELNYVVFDTEEYLYRLDMYDKLISDILDFPHKKILNTFELSTNSSKKP
ncbi:hypothetical protein COB64_03450 [Candidatus Wolfebacteria bacterium]|nr:MAG: hypothetical protein COB64_03450 [Candidatus Wolfebacteria bacterium]